MRTRRVLAPLLVGIGLLAGCGGETPRSERQRLIGVWRVMEYVDDGVVVPKKLRPGVDVTITDQHFIMKDILGSELRAAYEVRPGPSPKTIDLIRTFKHEPGSKSEEARPHI